MPPVLEAVDLHKSFGAVVAAADLNVVVGEREVVGMIGANGAGKPEYLVAAAEAGGDGRGGKTGPRPLRPRALRDTEGGFAAPGRAQAARYRHGYSRSAARCAPRRADERDQRR